MVANEVKALATQTRNATGEISGKIERLMRVADTSTQAMSHIITTVGEIRPVAESVAAAVAGQTHTITEIGRAAGEVTAFAEAVDQNARSIREAALSAEQTQSTIQASGRQMGHASDEMARHLLTVLRQTPMGNRRRHARWPVEIGGRLRQGGGAVQIKTADLSLGGALVKLPPGQSAPVGARITLELDGMPALRRAWPAPARSGAMSRSRRWRRRPLQSGSRPSPMIMSPSPAAPSAAQRLWLRPWRQR